MYFLSLVQIDDNEIALFIQKRKNDEVFDKCCRVINTQRSIMDPGTYNRSVLMSPSLRILQMKLKKIGQQIGNCYHQSTSPNEI